MTGETVVLRVETVGVQGDGIAHHGGERIFLPLTAPGDVVRARLGARRGEGRSGAVLGYDHAAARAEPRCPHFGACGGCTLQHLLPDAYGAAKTGWLVAALRQRGLDADAVLPLRLLAPGTRRRARFSLARPRAAKAPVELGFLARGSHRIVDIAACAVLHPALMALLAPLRQVAMHVVAPGQSAAATATLTDTGIDLLLDLDAAPQLAGLETLAEFARAMNVARLSWRAPGTPPSPIAQLRAPRIAFGGVAIDLPDEPFLQASAEADAALTAEVVAAVADASRIADLFAGIGTFALALAAGATVHAVERDAAAVRALAAAVARAGLGHRLTCERRDLDERPLTADELAAFDAVVFDPPRAGARAQAEMLARSGVKRVIAVSCNQATFARDARTLVDGGYRLTHIQPIDSFVWSAHLELVARFERR
jgi:23S rRNA (uracil1939-C5)-methyltransferase